MRSQRIVQGTFGLWEVQDWSMDVFLLEKHLVYDLEIVWKIHKEMGNDLNGIFWRDQFPGVEERSRF